MRKGLGFIGLVAAVAAALTVGAGTASGITICELPGVGNAPVCPPPVLPTPPPPQGPDRYIYCAGAGDVGADGKPLGLGQTLNLLFGEQVGSKFFPSATLGFWVQGLGLTCQLTPAQAALAAASTIKVNHTGAPNSQEGAPVYTYVPAA
jgi:hypothetical protein